MINRLGRSHGRWTILHQLGRQFTCPHHQTRRFDHFVDQAKGVGLGCIEQPSGQQKIAGNFVPTCQTSIEDTMAGTNPMRTSV